MELCADIAVVLPSAGTGERTRMSVPKQFFEIEGRPVISHTVEKFLEYGNVIKIIVVAATEQIEHMEYVMSCIPSRISKQRIKVTKGAESRHKSIYLGLKCLQNDGFKKDGIVVIHDGVRPFLNQKTFVEVVASAEIFSAAGIARNLVSTVISLDDENMLKETLNRNEYKASEMPQAFKFDVILNAYKKCPENVMDFGTECLDVAKTYGNVTPKIIYTDDMDAWKITYKMDLYTARNMIKVKQTVGIQGGKAFKLLWQTLIEHLNLQFNNVDCDCNRDETNYLNYVIFHSDISTSDVIHMAEFGRRDFDYPLTVVNIIFDGLHLTNLQSLQKEARITAESNISCKITSYYIVITPNLSKSDSEKIANLVTSLIFDANRYLSGTIIYF